MPSGLARLIQSDFAAGIQPDVARHLISDRGAYDIINGLLDDDGSVYRRGGSQLYADASGVGSSVRWVWDGLVSAGRRTMIATPTNFGVMDAADTALVNLGGDGLSVPYSVIECEEMLFIGGSTKSYIYAGSRKTADYATGTITATNGSKTVTGAGTTWNTLVDAGMLMQVGNERVYAIESVDSTTQVTLRDAYEGTTGAGKSYTFYPIYEMRTADPYPISQHYAFAGGRLLYVSENRMGFAGIDVAGGKSVPHTQGANDFHGFPGGVEILGLDSIGDAAVVFTSAGIWTVQGLSYEIVDEFGNAQHRRDNVNRDIALWGNGAGTSAWLSSLIVPGTDALYTFDLTNGVAQLSVTIENRYREYVRQGLIPGRPDIYQNHLILPIIQTDGSWVDTLVCRLDRPGESRGQVAYPWSRQDGSGAALAAVAVRAAANDDPILFGAQSATNGDLLKLNRWFEPDADVKNDHDGTIHDFSLITRDYLTGSLNLNRVRKFRAHYDMTDAASDDPVILTEYAIPGESNETAPQWGNVQWGNFQWGSDADTWNLLDGAAPETDDREPFVWWINRRVRAIRLRVRSSGSCAKLTLRHLELFVAPSRQIRD
jgi:hypothetical protein